MDYKELIEQLRKHHQSWAAYSDLELAHDLEDAITAIETLLAEREAAVEEMHGRCSKCKHFFPGFLEPHANTAAVREERSIIGSGAAPRRMTARRRRGEAYMRFGNVYRSTSQKEQKKYCWISPVFVIWLPRKIGEWLWKSNN